MDFIKNAIGGGNADKDHDGKPDNAVVPEAQNKEGGFNFGDTINGALGGGKSSEANEDYLDKTVDAIQQHVLGQGDQSNESAAEQFKDEQISDALRGAWKNSTGQDLPIKDKEH